jgi:hypothetical protein
MIPYRKVILFDTGLKVYEGWTRVYWLDNDSLIATAIPAGQAWGGVSGPDPNARVAFINFPARTVKFIIDDGNILRTDAERSIFLVGYTTRERDLQEVHITPDGRVSVLRQIHHGDPDLKLWPDVPKGPPVRSLTRGDIAYRDGYLTPAVVDYKKLQTDVEPIATLWVRPDGSRVLLKDVPFQEIGHPIWQEYSQRYLLTPSDPRLFAHEPSRSDRHFKTYPVRLIDLNGKVYQAPYPPFVFNYGLMTFEEFRFTATGALVTKTEDQPGDPPTGMYFYEGTQLYRLTGGGTFLGVESHPVVAYTIWDLELSPNGCRIAYTHRTGPPYTQKAWYPLVLSIIDLC